jgi:hypothetical protein
MIIYIYQEKENLYNTDFEELLCDFLKSSGHLTLPFFKKLPDDLLASVNWPNESPTIEDAGELLEKVKDFLALRADCFLLGVFEEGAIMSEYTGGMGPGFEWGINYPSDKISIDYAPSRARLINQVHETLHLFGVDDCYDTESKDPKDTCNNKLCLMRYGNNEREICDSVRQQLRGTITSVMEI